MTANAANTKSAARYGSSGGYRHFPTQQTPSSEDFKSAASANWAMGAAAVSVPMSTLPRTIVAQPDLAHPTQDQDNVDVQVVPLGKA
nr:hypothetical protein [Mycolicibacterium malmesburyense]